MSANEEKWDNLHVLLGIRDIDEKTIKALKEEFEKNGLKIETCTCKYQKFGIEKYIEENKDVNVVILQQFLQPQNPYTSSDFEKLNDLNSNLVIIPILSNEEIGTPFVNEILNLGIYTALFFKDAKLTNMVEMTATGRTRKDARLYYGIEKNIIETKDTANIKACIDHIIYGGDKNQTKDRVDYIQSKLSQKDFEEVIFNLPNEIKDRLKAFEEYTKYFEDSTSTNISKKSLFRNRFFKPLPSEAAEETDNPPIVTQEIQSAVKKVVVGFAGAQPRVGTTHQAILFGNYLNSFGYKIAIIENSQCNNISFNSIKDHCNTKEQGSYFTYKDIDYYPCFNLCELNQVFLKDYNFVLIDFGLYSEEMEMEFGRCVVQIIISGSKPWEFPMLEKLMSLVNNEDVLKKFYYLFMYAPENEKKDIKKNMDVLNKVYFPDYQADPFSSEGYPAIRDILEDYLPKGNRPLTMKNVVNNIRRLFD